MDNYVWAVERAVGVEHDKAFKNIIRTRWEVIGDEYGVMCVFVTRKQAREEVVFLNKYEPGIYRVRKYIREGE